MCLGKPWLPHWVSSAWWRCWWCLHFLCSVWWFLKSSINDTVTFKSCTLYIQIYKAEYSCTFINKYSVHYLIWNICIYAHKDVHIYKKLINKLVELHVNSYFFLNWDGWGLYGLPVPVLLKVSTQYSVVDLCLGLSGCRCVNEAVNEM